MNDQPQKDGSKDATHATQKVESSLNEAGASDADSEISDASDAEKINSVTQATQEKISPFNEAGAGADASDADAEGSVVVVDHQKYNLTVGQAQELFHKQNRKVPALRTVQQYCKDRRIAAELVSRSNGQEYLINDKSLLAFILAKPEFTDPPDHIATADLEPKPQIIKKPEGELPKDDLEQGTEIFGETRTLAELLVQNARLEEKVSGKKDVITAKNETISELKEDKGFIREELITKRKINGNRPACTALHIARDLRCSSSNRN